MAGGRGEVGGREQSIRTLAASRTVRDLKATSIVLPGGRKVRLDDLAVVQDAIEEPRTFARFNGEPVVAFAVSRGSGASDAEVATAVEKRIDEFRKTYPRRGFRRHRFIGFGHDRKLRFGDAHPDRGRCSRCHRGFPVLAGLARDLDRGGRPTALPSSRPSGRWMRWVLPSTASACSPSPSSPAFWWMTPSSRSRTSSGTCGWGSQHTGRRSRAPTRSVSPSLPLPPR